MNYKAIYLIASGIITCFIADNAIAKKTNVVELCGEFKQGEMIVGTTRNAQEVIFNGRKYPIDKDGKFILAFGRDEPATNYITVVYDEDNQHKIDLDIAPTKWDIENIKGLPQKKVTPDTSNDAEIMRERKDVKKSVTNVEKTEYWKEGFVLPVKGRISGNFGNQRILNGVKRNSHSGTDIAEKEGTPIKAAGSGRVTLSGGDYFYTGNMVVVDHGQGMQTLYAHLKTADVKVGEIVEKGDVIGTLGKTGRVTGAHLHWGASINDVRFRPHSLLEMKIDRSNCKKF